LSNDVRGLVEARVVNHHYLGIFSASVEDRFYTFGYAVSSLIVWNHD
jgi:hypothetical protein